MLESHCFIKRRFSDYPTIKSSSSQMQSGMLFLSQQLINFIHLSSHGMNSSSTKWPWRTPQPDFGSAALTEGRARLRSNQTAHQEVSLISPPSAGEAELISQITRCCAWLERKPASLLCSAAHV